MPFIQKLIICCILLILVVPTKLSRATKLLLYTHWANIIKGIAVQTKIDFVDQFKSQSFTCINIKHLSISRFEFKKERNITPALEFRLTRLKRSFNSKGEVMNLLSCTQGGMLQVSYFWQLSHTKRNSYLLSQLQSNVTSHISLINWLGSAHEMLQHLPHIQETS